MAVCFRDENDEVREEEGIGDEGEPDAWFPCSVSTQDDESGGGVGAPFYPALRWIVNGEKKKQLKVKFLEFNEEGRKDDKENDWRIKSWRQVAYPYDFITTKDILKWANEWSSEEHGLKDKVPEFVLCPEDEEGDIRVRFMVGKAGSKSLIGKDAQNYTNRYTMTINLAKPNNLKSDLLDYQQYVVTHEFGHALGLGHEHQSSRLVGALDKEAVIEDLVQKAGYKRKAAEEKFKQDYDQYTKDSEHGGPQEWSKLDPWSTMCYPLRKKFFIDAEKFKKDQKVTDDEFEMLTTQRYEKRKVLSQIDIDTILSLYSSVIMLCVEVKNTSSKDIIVSLPKPSQGEWITELPSSIKSGASAQATIKNLSTIEGSPLILITVQGHTGWEMRFSITYYKNGTHKASWSLPNTVPNLKISPNIFPINYSSEITGNCIVTIEDC